jgi:PAS domain S-box-containing protein
MLPLTKAALPVTALVGSMIDNAESRARLYQVLVENSLGLMCIHDLDGIVRSVNPAVAESLGYKPGNGVGLNLRDFLAPPVRHLFDDYLRRIRFEGKDSGLMRLQARDGSERIWMYRNTLYSPEGSAPLVLGHALDITDRIRAEKALKAAKAELRAANEELARRVEERTAELREANLRLTAEIEQRKQMEEELIRRRNLESLGVLAGGIAHDLNNFLTVVQGNVALARDEAGTGKPLEGRLDEIASACERAAFLASQLLTFSKGGAPVRRLVSVAQVVLDAVSLARAGSALSIATDIAANLWSAELDTAQIGQALQSVLLNAKEAMPAGGVVEVTARNLSIRSVAAHDGKYVRISVRDYGCGIPDDVLPRIFDPYFTTKPRARGLGLASAYSIVHKHGGFISVRSKPEHGTLVTIDLSASSAAPAPPPPEVAAARGGPWKLLVMDDEESIRNLLKSVLTALGHHVTCAAEGAEAVALYETAKASGQSYHAVLLDLTVQGGMGGIDTAARLREIDSSARLIVSSGYSDSPVLSDFRAYGFDDMIPKPWTPTQLGEVFGRVLAGRAARKQP